MTYIISPHMEASVHYFCKFRDESSPQEMSSSLHNFERKAFFFRSFERGFTFLEL